MILVEVTGGIIAGIDKEAMMLGDAVCGTVDCGVNSYPVTSLYLILLGCFLAFFLTNLTQFLSISTYK